MVQNAEKQSYFPLYLIILPPNYKINNDCDFFWFLCDFSHLPKAPSIFGLFNQQTSVGEDTILQHFWKYSRSAGTKKTIIEDNLARSDFAKAKSQVKIKL